MTRFAILAAAVGSLVAASAAGGAQAQATASGQAPQAAVMQELARCRTIQDPTERLACLDAATAKMQEAQAAGQVVVIDRDQAKADRKRAFGIHVPNLNPFKDAGGDDVDRIDATVKTSHLGLRGRWRFFMEDGAIWDQVDDNRLQHDPRPGSKAEIRKGVLGAYFLNLDDQLALRVRRVR